MSFKHEKDIQNRSVIEKVYYIVMFREKSKFYIFNTKNKISANIYMKAKKIVPEILALKYC